MQKYLGIIGDPVKHTLSPLMHNTALQEQGLEYLYLPFQVEANALKEALAGMQALGFVGFNVTIPHKVAIMPLLGQLSAEARLIGAVNTVHWSDGNWVGYNTDGVGFLRSLREEGGIEPTGRRVLILGAGGAARAVAVQLGLAGAGEVVIANRTKLKAVELAEELGKKIPQCHYRGCSFTAEELQQACADAEIIINATPIGMESYPEQDFPLKIEWLQGARLAVDLIYRPRLTPFLKLAEDVGAAVLTGDGMLLYQGVEAYRIWTGTEPPVEVMRKALLEGLKRR